MDEIEILFDAVEENKLITETARKVKSYIQKTWPQFEVHLEMPLKLLFPDPGKGGLKSIWEHGAADVVIYKNKKLIAILEPGGAHHFLDPKQIRRDKRKWKLCQINGVKCFRFANSLFFSLSNRKLRSMFGKVIFGTN